MPRGPINPGAARGELPKTPTQRLDVLERDLKLLSANVERLATAVNNLTSTSGTTNRTESPSPPPIAPGKLDALQSNLASLTEELRHTTAIFNTHLRNHDTVIPTRGVN